MASIADIITNAAKFASGGEAEVQQRAMNKQVLATNQRALDAQSDKELGGVLSGSQMRQFMKFNKDGNPAAPLVEFNFVEAYKANPELGTRFLNRMPQEALRYYDESGQLKQGKIAGLKQYEDGRIGLVIEREDGKRAPMTRGATTSPDDNVILMTPEQLNNMATNRVLTMRANDAFDTGSEFERQWAEMTDAVGKANVEQEALVRNEIEQFIRASGVPPEVARELIAMANELDDEALLDFASEMLGIDVAALWEQPADDAALTSGGSTAQPESNIPDSRGVRTNQVTAPIAGALPGGLGTALTAAAAATDAGGAIGAHEAMFGEGGSRTLRDIGAVTSNAVAGILPGGLGNGLRVPPEEAAAASGRLGKQLTDASVGLHKRVFGAASDDIRMDEPPPATPPRDPSAPPTPGSREALKAVQDRITPPAEVPAPDRVTAADKTRIMGLINGQEPADPAKSSISPALATAPEPVKEAIANDTMDPAARRQAILDAISEGLANPNEQQVAYVRDYMTKNNYTTPQSLSAAPPAEVMNIAFTMASLMGPDTTLDQRIAAASSIMNFAQFGSPDTNAEDVQRLQIDKAKLQLDGKELARKLAEDAGKPVAEVEKQYDSAFDPAMKYLETVSASLDRDDRGFTNGKMAREGWEAYKAIHNRYMTAKGAGRAGIAAAYEQAFAQALPEVLAAHILNEPRANLAEWVTGPVQDWFGRAEYRKLSPDFSDFRVEYDAKGNAKFLYLVTPKGVDAEGGQINMKQLNQKFGNGTAEFIIETIEKTQQLKTPKE